jgi:hypothetical protein
MSTGDTKNFTQRRKNAEKGAKLGSSFLGAFLCVFAPLREKIPLDTAFQ